MAETRVKSLRLPGALWDALEAKAAAAGVTCNAFMAKALSEVMGDDLAPAADTGPRPLRPARKSKVKTAKAVLEKAEAGAAHLGIPAPHVIQVGPKRPMPGAMLKRRPRFG